MVIFYNFWSKFDRTIVAAIRENFSSDLAALTLTAKNASKHIHLVSSKFADEVEVLESPIQPTAFSAMVIKNGEQMIVPSLKEIPVEYGCPLMTAEGFQSYCGIPLKTSEGTIGAVQLINSGETEWCVDDVEALKQFAIPLANYFDTQVPNSLSDLRML